MFRVISDTHYEFFKSVAKTLTHVNSIVPTSVSERTLVLAGDICKYTTTDGSTPRLELVLKAFKQNWSNVLFVPGNHEYYGSQRPPSDVDKDLTAMCQRAGVEFLQKRRITIDGVDISGCTLWSDIDSTGAALMNDIGQVFPTAAAYRKEFKDHLEWLQGNAATVVVTHHLPSSKCVHQRFHGYPGQSGFATPLDTDPRYGLTEWFTGGVSVVTPKYWIHGHSHESTDITIGGVRVLSNPVGYPGERRVTKVTDTVVKPDPVGFHL
jgi:Icc-related predicted phosphoesterase